MWPVGSRELCRPRTEVEGKLVTESDLSLRAPAQVAAVLVDELTVQRGAHLGSEQAFLFGLPVSLVEPRRAFLEVAVEFPSVPSPPHGTGRASRFEYPGNRAAGSAGTVRAGVALAANIRTGEDMSGPALVATGRERSAQGKGSAAVSEPERYTLQAPGAVLCYDVRDNGGAGHPVLLLIGCPMGASGFAALAGQFADRTVVTYDPRGSERSQRTDGQPPGSVPDEHAEDLRRLIQALDAGQADVFGSSGGAVNGLALVARHPGLIRTLVAHEPPAAQELPDREAVLAVCASIRETYQRSSFGRRWPSSSRWPATRARSRPALPGSPPRIPPHSGCLPATTALATTRCSDRT